MHFAACDCDRGGQGSVGATAGVHQTHRPNDTREMLGRAEMQCVREGGGGSVGGRPIEAERR